MILKRLNCYLLVMLLAVPMIWSQERAIRPVTSEAISENRQALVIGNSEYQYAGRLRNPVNDARAIGSTLKQLGFKVTTITNADQRKIERSIRNFGKQLKRNKGVGLFYFAGHGMQFDGENYLLPTDIDPSTEEDVRYDAVPLGKLLAQMRAADNGMNIVVLDACRNNPFARTFRSSSRGLAQVVAPTGSFISYATAPGQVAADGVGSNGLFTEKLLKHITTPGLTLEQFFKRVRTDVQQESNNKQVPWDSSSVTGEFFFVPAEGATVLIPAASASDQDFATQAWEVVKDSNDPALLEEFIKMFPAAPQINLARLKLIARSSIASKDTPVASASTTNWGQVLQKIDPLVQKPSPLTSNALSGDAAKKKLLETNECAGCDLRGAGLSGANLSGANLRAANLRAAALLDANLNRADLRETNLNRASMSRANLNRADLRGANLTEARLHSVNLSFADLRNADVYEADLHEANYPVKFCKTKMPDGSINNRDC